MDTILIHGGVPLQGRVQISGAKNATLPLMAACLLTSQPIVLKGVPQLADINTLANLLGELGVTINKSVGLNDVNCMTLCARSVNNTKAPYELVRKMRASILVLGPLLARFGEAVVSLPGGCAIGSRPVDIHLSGLESLGATIKLKNGYIRASAPNGLKGTHYRLNKPSVGATENLLMAAVLANGNTILDNTAREPEINDLINCLCAMGAIIKGKGTSCLQIYGQTKLHGTTHSVMADRIEAGTYAIASAISDGSVELVGAEPTHLEAPIQLLRNAGVKVTPTKHGIRVEGAKQLKSVDVITQPYPGFPTDLQAQTMVLMSVANKEALFREKVFENRFMHVPELSRMGANIKLNDGDAIVKGVKELKGAPVMATDLRASSCLVLAGLAARGSTKVSRVYHLDRGYEKIEKKLALLGANIERVSTA